MESLIQILVSGLTLGAMYAVSTIGLSLVWGSMGMLNMAHGALLTIGAYAAYGMVQTLGLPVWLGLPGSMAAGFIVGLLIYGLIIRQMYRHPSFETNVIIATVGLAIVLENTVLTIFGAYPAKQPMSVSGGFGFGGVHVPFQNVVILLVSLALMLAIAWLLGRTRIGRAIRATAQMKEAALLMGVPVGRVFAQVMALAGVVAAVSGIMLSSITTLSPTMGHDPMLKAFIVCVIAGLGRIQGAIFFAFVLGVFEAAVQYYVGVRFAFPAMLLLVIAVLIWRPYGMFGQVRVTRV
ncbi:MAG TPA: branched-chain amino acid ABC transporter permease [Arenicellales bacterium]|nr:branched-chain amino acid ABC transporter permease [Arenicellales bacterium]